jgi:hypothetical protein
VTGAISVVIAPALQSGKAFAGSVASSFETALLSRPQRLTEKAASKTCLFREVALS